MKTKEQYNKIALDVRKEHKEIEKLIKKVEQSAQCGKMEIRCACHRDIIQQIEKLCIKNGLLFKYIGTDNGKGEYIQVQINWN